jgi:elongation factor Ts
MPLGTEFYVNEDGLILYERGKEMAEITAGLIKELREKTGAGMMDCKIALTEVKGDFEGAVDWLRKKGLAAASKKSGRVAAEGLVGVITQGTCGAAVEVNAETDFVGRNDQFQSFVSQVSQLALEAKGNKESLEKAAYPQSQRNVSEELTHLIATIGENMTLRRSAYLSVSQGVVVEYMHSAVVPNLGRIGVLVGLESSAPADQLIAFGKQVAMHIAAAAPIALTTDEVDSSLVERERNIFLEQAKATGRPDDIIQKMVEGRVRKYYEDVVLLEQAFVMDGKTRIADVVTQKSKEWGVPVKVTGFIRYMLGEGIEKTASDFADEVARMAQ